MKKEVKINDKILALMEKGIKIPSPSAVEIGDDVDLKRISGRGVTLHSGTKLFGSETLIGTGVTLGCEAPMTVVNCQIGRGADLRGGFCRESIFLEEVSVDSGAQIREGCLLEDGVRIGHSVGLKHTVLFPFVTLGSLINFCDCLMAGGTSRKNHSEVGSSYIHFNYTPNQDKATPSLMGDVPRGVMINQPPIFLGGQGGMVGPVRLEYGTIVRAGTILRQDSLKAGRLIGGQARPAKDTRFEKGLCGDAERKVRNNVHYLASLLALRQWYIHIRRLFFRAGEFGDEMGKGAKRILEMALLERLQRLREFIKLAQAEHAFVRELSWPKLALCVTSGHEETVALRERDAFIRIVEDHIKRDGPDYIRLIQGLTVKETTLGTAWLQSTVEELMTRAGQALPSRSRKKQTDREYRHS